MIFDNIKNIDTYNLSKEMVHVLKREAEFSSENYQTSRVDLGNGCFLLPNVYETQIKEKTILEAHTKYIDVMYMVEGTEIIKIKSTSNLKNITSPYNTEGDYLLAEDNSDLSTIRLNSGDFIILYPQDAHCPSCAVDNKPVTVKKVIGKVLIRE